MHYPNCLFQGTRVIHVLLLILSLLSLVLLLVLLITATHYALLLSTLLQQSFLIKFCVSNQIDLLPPFD